MTSQALLPGHDKATPSGSADQAGLVLLLTPSRGLGGGIERYVATVESALADCAVSYQRLDLARPGLSGHWALLRQAAAALAATPRPTRVIVAHRALLPTAALLARIRNVSGISVIFYGCDVWGSKASPRWQVESRLMRRNDVRRVAISSFTAGSILPYGEAGILPPGLSSAWFSELVRAAENRAIHSTATVGVMERPRLVVMTAFRLSEWRNKGLPQLTSAIATIGRADIGLVVCGSGEPSKDLLDHVNSYPWCKLRPRLTDVELAAQFAAADLFVLATRTRHGREACGEGFGLVLLEAQVAGTAVVGPAHGGGLDAYLDGVTGATPKDESVSALAQVLGELVREPGRLAEMGERGATLARMRFSPNRYTQLAIDRLL